MRDEAWANLAAMFFDRATAGGDAPFLWSKHDGAYRPQSWRAIADEVSALSRGLRALGVARDDRVVLVSENRPNWVVADLAIMAAGAVPVPAYTTNTTDDHGHILTDSGAAAAIVSTPALAERLLPAADAAPELRFVVAMDPPERVAGHAVAIHAWDEVVARGRAAPDDVADLVGRLSRRDLACIIYTSGTGGRPKGVMLSHAAILCNVGGAHGLLAGLGLTDEVFLSFLPLSHSYEHTAGLHFPISIGAQIYYAEGAETLAANLVEVRPTIRHLRAPAVRDHAPAHPGGCQAQQGTEAQAVRRGTRPRPPALRGPGRLVVRRTAGRPAGRAAGARQGARALRRPAQGAGLGRRAVELRRRAVLRRARSAAAAGLWPDRVGADHLGQPARAQQAAHGRPAARRRRGPDRRGRRNPGARRTGHGRLFGTTRKPPPRRSPTAGCIPATSVCWTPTATSRSPTARRTSSSIRAATTWRPSASRACSRSSPRLPRRWCSATAART